MVRQRGIRRRVLCVDENPCVAPPQGQLQVRHDVDGAGQEPEDGCLSLSPLRKIRPPGTSGCRFPNWRRRHEKNLRKPHFSPSCCQCPPTHSTLLVLRRAPSFARLCNRSETIRSSSAAPSEGWWRRGESNSRPKWSHRSFYVCIRSFNLVTAAADRQATSATSVHVKFRSKARSHNFRTNLHLSPHSA
jgi:hypothetical protein